MHVTSGYDSRMRPRQIVGCPPQPLKAQCVGQPRRVALDRCANDPREGIGDDEVVSRTWKHDGGAELRFLVAAMGRRHMHQTAVIVRVPGLYAAEAERRARRVATGAGRPLRHVGDDAHRRRMPA